MHFKDKKTKSNSIDPTSQPIYIFLIIAVSSDATKLSADFLYLFILGKYRDVLNTYNVFTFFVL